LINSDLSDASDEGSDVEQDFRDILNAKLGSIELTSEPQYAASPSEQVVVVDDDASEELEFRLFASGPITSSKIRVKSPDLGNKPMGFVVPNRPDSYYFKEAVSTRESSEFDSVALSSEQILSLSKVPWPGCSLPWRVRVVSPKESGGNINQKTLLGHAAKMEAPVIRSLRTKPSKKARIARRKKALAAEKGKAEAAEKEAALREKKTRKNRLQKLKRREKKRNEKAPASTGPAESDGESSS
jgi:Fungal protein of unknown function (DUF2011)